MEEGKVPSSMVGKAVAAGSWCHVHLTCSLTYKKLQTNGYLQQVLSQRQHFAFEKEPARFKTYMANNHFLLHLYCTGLVSSLQQLYSLFISQRMVVSCNI